MCLSKTPLSWRESAFLIVLTITLLISGLLFSGLVHAESDDGGLLDFIINPDNTTATITGFTAGKSPVTLTIPDSVSTGGNTYSVISIGDHAFYNSQLTSVTIGNSVISIDDYAFFGSQLTSITIGNSVTIIGRYAFAYSQLTSATIDATIIGDYAFFGSQLTSVTIGNNVSSIGDFAFARNSLNSFVIPDSVVNVGLFALEWNSLNMVIQSDSVRCLGSPIVSAYWGDSSIHLSSNVSCKGGDAFDEASLDSASSNQEPTADAGANQRIQDDSVPGATVTLSAVNSSDDSGIVSYSWSGSDGSTYSGISPTVNAPVGTTVYTLTVTDADGISDTDTVSITVNAYSPAFSDTITAALLSGKTYQGHFYKFYSDRLTWTAAKDFAEDLGGYLVIVNNASENNFIKTNINGLSFSGSASDGGGAKYVWLGGSDTNVEGQWKWVDGSSVPRNNSTNKYWGDGAGHGAGGSEPDNFDNQDCLAIGLEGWPTFNPGFYGSKGQWNDIDCSNRLGFIVEFDSATDASGSGDQTNNGDDDASGDGNDSSGENSGSETGNNTSKPAPTNFVASDGESNDYVYMTWDTVEEAVKYRIERRRYQDGIETSSYSWKYTDKNIGSFQWYSFTIDEKFSFRVYSCFDDDCEERSAGYAQDDGKTGYLNTIDTPQQFTASKGAFEKHVELSWAPVEEAESYKLITCNEGNKECTGWSGSYLTETTYSDTFGNSNTLLQYRVSSCVKKEWEGYAEEYFCTDSAKAYGFRGKIQVPQQSLSKIIRTDGTATDSTISIGASSDSGETTDTTFTVDDGVTLTAKVYPDSNDVAKEGELYVVMRSTIDGKKTFYALNEDGNWEPWNASLKTLPAAKYIESLEEVEDILIYSGTITAGVRLFYVGYSLFTEDGKPFITTSLSPYKITVSE